MQIGNPDQAGMSPSVALGVEANLHDDLCINALMLLIFELLAVALVASFMLTLLKRYHEYNLQEIAARYRAANSTHIQHMYWITTHV
ncbi:unnamed protein product [Orchesella dallaii]|uniref:Uncharacterized protein n=1 Tax=Orchesella dallaii TaxID=48710 RepID=A0ABP1RQ07_9HEXA